MARRMLAAAVMRTLAHLALLASLAAPAVGCSEMHGRTEDAGSTATDAPPLFHDAACRCDVPIIVVDAGVSSCRAEDATAMTCALTCDGPPSWHWNGDRCAPIDCGACVGDDCAPAPHTEAECVSAHATCEASLCRATGGDWLWWAEECGHRVCGAPVLATCEAGFAICDCGPSESFVPGFGCQTDASCGDPPPRTREILCTDTGGSWENICCDTTCGVRCAAECLAPACNCGAMRIFDDARGCREDAECFEPALGASCPSGARCPDGTICCDTCGGAGCSGMPTCRAPVCDADPTIDECGNNLLAP